MSHAQKPIVSSGNVFADLGVPNPEAELTKARLAEVVRRLIEANNLTQKEAAARMGTGQPKVSAIMGGKLTGFTADRLLEFIQRLECDVEITITQGQKRRGKVSVTCSV